MESVNILSIDMDYILEPCINLYNDLSNSDNPQKIWDKINEIRSIDKHLSFNEDNLKLIFNIFTNKLLQLKDKTKVVFADNHDAILYELTSPEYYDKKFNIYNIDHHHDINYTQEQADRVDRYDAVDMTNWVWYLDKYKLINNYYWIKNLNSGVYTGPKLNGNFVEVQNIRQCNIMSEPIDYIFVCNSPQWFPRKYDLYFNMLIDICKNFTGLDILVSDKVFCEGNKSRPYNGANKD